MNIIQYYSYKDEYKRDISKNETIHKIRIIMSKYKKELVLKFLNHVALKLGSGNNIDNNIKTQEELFGVSFEKYRIMHLRAHLVLFQFFYEIETFNDKDESKVIDPKDVCNFYLLANHLLDKVEYKSENYKGGEIPIKFLMGVLKMSIDFIGGNDIRSQNELFISFYERLESQEEAAYFDKILYEKTGLRLKDFIEILKKFRDIEKQDHIELFKKLDKSMVLKYDDVNKMWKERLPVLPIPFDYRFLEQFPLILRDDEYYVTSLMLLFRNLIYKPYHILSEETKSDKINFRQFFTKKITEPVIKEKLKEIFVCDDIKEIKVQSDNNEFADYGLIYGDNIFLFEIKSVNMGLQLRYTDDAEEFKTEFDKRYILNSKGEHQQINQLLNIEENYNKFIEVTGLDKTIKYKMFCVELVFDEVLKCFRINPFNAYVRDEFKKRIDLDNFEKILPFPKNILITFNELLLLKDKILKPEKRLLILKTFFNYEPFSFESLISDLENDIVKLEGISKEDFRIINSEA